MWSNATAAIQQAKNVVDERVVKQLPAQLPNVNVQQSMGSAGDQAQKWREGLIGYVKSAQLDKLGGRFRVVNQSFRINMSVYRPGLQDGVAIDPD